MKKVQVDGIIRNATSEEIADFDARKAEAAAKKIAAAPAKFNAALLAQIMVLHQKTLRAIIEDTAETPPPNGHASWLAKYRAEIKALRDQWQSVTP